VSASDPEQAILDELARPAGRWQPGPPSPGGIQAGTVSGGNPFQADLSTVRFVKHRQSQRRRLHFVTFDGMIPHLDNRTLTFNYLFPLERDPEGNWRSLGGAGGGDDAPRRSTPWVNLAGGDAGDHFYAGGRIDGAGIDIARVQLRFADDRTLEDDSEQGVALFITDEAVSMAATVVLLDHAGNEVAAHPAFPSP
jgi:hypothetical protein